MNLHADGGGPLLLDFGTGPTSTVSFTISPNGTYVLKSQIASAVTATGWADAAANLPVLGNVAFRLIKKGTATLEITAETSQPSYGYLAVAGPDVGVAVANVYSSTPLAVNVAVYDGSGKSLGQGSLTIPPLGHTAFRSLVTTYLTYLQDFGAIPQLIISVENDSNATNAFASNGTTVQINLALGELISDSPSEFAFIVGHELAHIYQQRTSKFGQQIT